MIESRRWIGPSVDFRHGALGSARVWDTKTAAVTASLIGHVGAVLCAQFVAQSKQVATCGVDETVRLWN